MPYDFDFCGAMPTFFPALVGPVRFGNFFYLNSTNKDNGNLDSEEARGSALRGLPIAFSRPRFHSLSLTRKCDLWYWLQY
jgi:hypothetical protein